jgi:hypothetical protein
MFYKPFKDDITDYICISMEAVLVLNLILLIVMKTNENVFSNNVKMGIAYLIVGVDAAMMLVAIGWWGWRTLKSEVFTWCCYTKLQEN